MIRDRDLAAAGDIVRSRCAELGLPLWRFDSHAQETSGPEFPGLAGLWLSGDALSQEIARVVASWNGAEKVEPSEVIIGGWLIGIPEIRRRRCVGYSVVLALSAAALETAEFKRLCQGAHLDAAAARRALEPLARFDRAGIERLQKLLVWSIGDQAELNESKAALAGFTQQLTDSYETMDLLYRLGRSMNDVTRPQHFLSQACHLLSSTTLFSVVAIRLDAEYASLFCDDEAGTAARTPGTVFLTTGRSSEFDLSPLVERLPKDRGAVTPGAIILNDVEFAPEGPMQAIALPLSCKGKIAGFLMATGKGGDDPQISSYDSQLLEATASYIGAFLDNSASYRTQRALFLGTIEALAAAIDAKDSYTCGHSRRVAMISHSIALAIGMSASEAERVRIAGLVHDVGKIGVPEAVLCKGGRLTDEEFAEIKKHPVIGHRILKDLPSFEDVLPGVLHHHERMDGRGYPAGLSGEAIPMVARIIGVADTFDAMSSSRSYRAAMPREKVLSELQRSAGAQLDPDMVKAFLTLDLAVYDQMVAEAAAQIPIRTETAAHAEAPRAAA